MTQLELLAARVRGADNNADAAEIIADWYDSKVKHSISNSRESAKISLEGAARIGGSAETLLHQVAKNFETSASILEFDRQA